MKDIKNYEGLYAITSCGKVWSYRNQKFLIPEVTNAGYFRYRLSNGCKVRKFLAHRLVAEAYLPNPDNLPEVSHKDENKNHNWLSNLEWSTRLDNCRMPLHRKRLSEATTNYWQEVHAS